MSNSVHNKNLLSNNIFVYIHKYYTKLDALMLGD